MPGSHGELPEGSRRGPRLGASAGEGAQLLVSVRAALFTRMCRPPALGCSGRFPVPRALLPAVPSLGRSAPPSGLWVSSPSFPGLLSPTRRFRGSPERSPGRAPRGISGALSAFPRFPGVRFPCPTAALSAVTYGPVNLPPSSGPPHSVPEVVPRSLRPRTRTRIPSSPVPSGFWATPPGPPSPSSPPHTTGTPHSVPVPPGGIGYRVTPPPHGGARHLC